MKPPHLSDILEDWIKKDKWLRNHFGVYRRRQLAISEWPSILDEADYFVGMSCDAVGVAYAIMHDHVYYKDTNDGPKIKFMAADEGFFEKIKKDMTNFHTTVFPAGVRCHPDKYGAF